MKIIAMHLIPTVVENAIGDPRIVYLDFIKNRVFDKHGVLIPEEEIKDVYEVFKAQRVVMPELPSELANQIIRTKKEVIDGSKSPEIESRYLEPTEEGTTTTENGEY